MGTQAELDALERALDEKGKEFDKIDDEYNRLVTAQTNMDALYDEFKNYKKQIEDALDSYNEDGNQWVGAFYDEMEKAEDSIDSCIEKFEGTKDDLDFKVSDHYIIRMDIQIEINNLVDEIDRFELDDDDDEEILPEEGGMIP